MIISRLLSFVFRGLEFLSAIVVVGLVSHFLAQYDNVQVGPHGREIYTDCVAAISMVISLIWLLPFTWTFMHYPLDFLLSFAWFAAFGALYSWIHINGIKCLGYFSIFHWDGVEHTDYCHQWMTAEAFCFMSGVFWLISALLSIHVFHRVRRRSGPRTRGV